MTHPPPSGPSNPPPPGGPKTGEPLLTVAEVAALWRCSPQHIYNLIDAGDLRYLHISDSRAKVRVPESALAEYVSRRVRREPGRGRRRAAA